MKTIKAYKTIDGKVFENYDEAVAHDKKVRFETDLKKFVDEMCYNGMDKHAIFDILKENVEELRAIMNVLITD